MSTVASLRRRRAPDDVGRLEEDVARFADDVRSGTVPRTTVRRITASTVAKAWELVVFDASGVTITLPAAVPALSGVQVSVARSGALATGSATINTAGGALRNGTALTLASAAAITFICTGKEWV